MGELGLKNKKRINPVDVENKVNEQAGNFKDIHRPHRLSFDVTTKQLAKFKMLCFERKIPQGDLNYTIFEQWLNEQTMNL